LLGTAVTGVVTFFYAAWARRETEAQIGKMQLNSYNTPGAETPVPPQVMATGVSTLGAVWWVQHNILRQKGSGAIFSMLLGAAAGVAALFVMSTDDPMK
jgi:hypothetical protein